ncbi:RNA polymerase sigma-70 factor [Bacteroidota bacterium]
MIDSEAQLLNGIKSGDEYAFEFIYNQFYTSLCVFAARIIKDKNAAEEIVQDVIINIWEKKLDINIETSFKLYLFKSVHNRSLNYLKRRKLESECMLSLSNRLKDFYIHHSDEIVNKELDNKINEAIEKMPEQTKKIFKQSRFEGLKYKDIAVIEDMTVKGIEFHMSKALKFLKKELSEYIYLLLLIYLNLN